MSRKFKWKKNIKWMACARAAHELMGRASSMPGNHYKLVSDESSLTFISELKLLRSQNIYLEYHIMSCLTLKRPFTFEEDFADIVPLKQRRLQIQMISNPPEPKPKATQSNKVPDDIQESLKYLPPLPDMDSSDSEMEVQTTSANNSPVSVKASEDATLFNTKQLLSMCRNMIEECENRLREEYEQVLTQKMAEQYDTFIKFTHDQMYRDNGQCSSYLK